MTPLRIRLEVEGDASELAPVLLALASIEHGEGAANAPRSSALPAEATAPSPPEEALHEPERVVPEVRDVGDMPAPEPDEPRADVGLPGVQDGAGEAVAAPEGAQTDGLSDYGQRLVEARAKLDAAIEEESGRRRCTVCGRPVKNGPRCQSCASKQRWESKHNGHAVEAVITPPRGSKAAPIPVTLPPPLPVVDDLVCSCKEQRAVIARGDWHEASCPMHAHRFSLPSTPDESGVYIGRCGCGATKGHDPFNTMAKAVPV